MPRRPRDERLGTRTERLRLAPRREPYWRSIAEGMALGYRRIEGKAGSWIARFYRPEDRTRRYQAIGTADDFTDADGHRVLTYAHAVDTARTWFRTQAAEAAGGIEPGKATVGDALDRYFADQRANGARSVRTAEILAQAFIPDTLRRITLAKLTETDLKRWREKVASSEARIGQRADLTQGERERRRRNTANRIWSILRATLNKAHADKLVPHDDAWSRIVPLKNANAARIRYLTDDEARRLVNACQEPFRSLVVGALLTGMRYGELARMVAGDYDPRARVVHVPIAKSGRARTVPLTGEGVAFFDRMTAGKPAGALVFTRPSGGAWGVSNQHTPIVVACQRAHIAPHISFHVLRHTYASRLAMAGTPMPVIAAALGHSNSRITEAHYAHLAPSYVADTLRAASAPLGIVVEDRTMARLAS